MQKDVATTRYYNILIKSSQPSPAKAAEPKAKPAIDSLSTAVPPTTRIDSPQTRGSRSELDGLQDSVALQLFAQKTTELNQLVAELTSKLADAESERQTLKLQAKLVYGLVSEVKSLRAITNTSVNSDETIPLSATQRRFSNRKRGHRAKQWKDSMIIACLLMSTVAATAFVMENVPQRSYSLFSPR